MTFNLTLGGVSAEEWDLSHFLMHHERLTTTFLGFKLVDSKTPRFNMQIHHEPFSFWTNETQELLEAQPVSWIFLQ